jgi:hypothetical protein
VVLIFTKIIGGFINELTANGLQIAEGGELEVQFLNIAQMMIRSTTLDFSTTSPLLAMCCYVSVFFFIFCAWAIKSLNH